MTVPIPAIVIVSALGVMTIAATPRPLPRPQGSRVAAGQPDELMLFN